MGITGRSMAFARLVASLAAGACASPAAAQTFLVDTGPASLGGQPATTPSPDGSGSTWNNFSPGQTVRLVDTGGAFSASSGPQGIRLTSTTPVSTSVDISEGLASPDPALLGDLAVQSATQDYLVQLDFGGTVFGLELADLDPGLIYGLRFFASKTLGQINAATRYTVIGGNGVQAVTLATSNNDDTVAAITGVTPRGDGTIAIEVASESGTFMFLNAMALDAGTGGPAITFGVQPEGTITDAGGALTLSAAVTGSEPGLELRWERDGVPLTDGGRVTGATTDTLVISPASLDDAGVYRLRATLGGATEYSSDAIVGVRGLGPADDDGNGVIDFFDFMSFLSRHEEDRP
jgi:hypothetical protein